MAAKPCVARLWADGPLCEASKNAPVHSRHHPSYHAYLDKTPAGIQPMSAGMRAFRKDSGYDRELQEAKGQPCQAMIAPNCRGVAEHLHEDKTRGRFGGLRGSIRAGTRRVPCCDPCNDYIAIHPVEAREKGLLVSVKDEPKP